MQFKNNRIFVGFQYAETASKWFVLSLQNAAVILPDI